MWQDVVSGFGLAVVAYVATNLDNLLVLGALAAGGSGIRPLARGFLGASLAVLAVSLAFAVLPYLIPARLLGYLGIVPVILGVRMLLASPARDAAPAAAAVTARGVGLMLIANSADTIAVVGPLFAESAPGARLGLAAGFVSAAAILLAALHRVSARAAVLTVDGRSLHRLVPLVMIAIGAYVLWDSGTDVQ